MNMYPVPADHEHGNDHVYDPENLEKRMSKLNGKNLAMLGSSITYGYGSGGISFAEMIAARNSCHVHKQAISGTTLAYVPEREDTHPEISYVRQLLDHFGKEEHPDAFVVQLSTNDASKNIPLGDISGSLDENDFDQGTVTGAMEFILAWIRRNFDCPVVFYINAFLDRGYLEHTAAMHPEYPSDTDRAEQNLIVFYEQMIARLYELQEKWHFGIADLWNDDTMRNLPYAQKDTYMNDPIHPMKSGYLFYYVPAIEKALEEML